MECDEKLYHFVHSSGSLKWLGLQELPSSLVGERAAVCIDWCDSGLCCVPACPPNVLGYITAWTPFDSVDGGSKWCWLGENGEQLILSGQDAYRAVRVAQISFTDRQLRFCDVLLARQKALLSSNTSEKSERVCLKHENEIIDDKSPSISAGLHVQNRKRRPAEHQFDSS
jgi:hypothetical protein